MIPRILFVFMIAGSILNRTNGNGDEDQGRWYIGITAAAARFEASYDKITDNRDPRNESPLEQKVFQDRGIADDTGYGFGFLAGYRMPLGKGDLYLSSEIDATFHGGKAHGRLLGVPRAQEIYQYGQSWPENWFFERKRSYGLTFKLGGRPEFLQSLLGPDASLYALAGVRYLETRLHISWMGCSVPNPPCQDQTDEAFVVGMDDWDRGLTGWTGGLGFEKMLGSNLALRSEWRYTGYEKKEWVSLPDEGRVRVPAELDGDENSLSLSLVWYF